MTSRTEGTEIAPYTTENTRLYVGGAVIQLIAGEKLIACQWMQDDIDQAFEDGTLQVQDMHGSAVAYANRKHQRDGAAARVEAEERRISELDRLFRQARHSGPVE